MGAALAFGPVPSRRLGRSLGINNIPPKVCSYACIYCQVGPTTTRSVQAAAFHSPEEVRESVAVRMAAAGAEAVDHLTFVPDGEPTLDSGLGRSIRLLRSLGKPVAVISNGSLLWRPEVREALAAADWVSVKVDAVDGAVWRRVDHPASGLDPDRVLEGIREFAAGFPGVLCTETMLVAGVNDSAASVDAVAGFVSGLGPAVAYLAVPTRPPAMPGVRPPDEGVLNRAYHRMARRLSRVELLVGYEGDAFASTGDAAADVLAVTAVHPMRHSAVAEVLAAGGAGWRVIDDLVESGELRRVEYRGHVYYLRRYS